MNDFKTSGCKPSHTGDSPYIWNIESNGGLIFSDSFALPRGVILDCENVTFRLKELEINLSESKTKVYLDNIDTLTINGVKFVKLESKGKSEGIRE